MCEKVLHVISKFMSHGICLHSQIKINLNTCNGNLLMYVRNLIGVTLPAIMNQF
jgi:hypothetical protein